LLTPAERKSSADATIRRERIFGIGNQIPMIQILRKEKERLA
jgi:hypothetical protein